MARCGAHSKDHKQRIAYQTGGRLHLIILPNYPRQSEGGIYLKAIIVHFASTIDNSNFSPRKRLISWCFLICENN